MNIFSGALFLIMTFGLVKGQCQLDCYTMDQYCIDHGEGISPDDRYECKPCGDICPLKDADPNERPSLGCIDHCSHFLRYRSEEKRLSGFLGATLTGDIVITSATVLSFFVLCVICILFAKEKNKRRMKYRNYTNVTELNSTEGDPRSVVNISTVNHVSNEQPKTNGQINGYSHGQQIPRNNSETDMVLNSAGTRRPVSHSTPTDEGRDIQTQVLKS